MTIEKPTADRVLGWNETVSYLINVSDEEDGYTAYEEITSLEVLLQVKYVSDANEAEAWAKHADKENLQPLFHMGRAACLTCHSFRSKLIGPSFREIAHKYHDQGHLTEVMVRRVMEGSKGIWGEVEMAPHPDLDPKEIRAMVDWIVGNGMNPNVDYLVGTAGAFKTKELNKDETGAYILTALYKDHGIEKSQNGELVGRQVLALPMEKDK